MFQPLLGPGRLQRINGTTGLSSLKQEDQAVVPIPPPANSCGLSLLGHNFLRQLLPVGRNSPFIEKR